MDGPPRRHGMVVAWAGSIAALAIADIILNRRQDGSTLSECARYVFRTDTTAGKAVFVASWAGLSAWLIPHLCRTSAVGSAHK